MHRKTPILLLAAGLASGFVAWLRPSPCVAATGGSGSSVAEIDADGDFLPDVVEWVSLTSSVNPDTDGDQIPDFVEVIEGGQPRHESVSLPPDQQMRVFLTGPGPGNASEPTWLHVFYRIMPGAGGGAAAGSIQSFACWLENPAIPGFAFPINVLSACGGYYRERETSSDGTWIQLSVPMVSESLLHSLLPCTIWVETTVGGQQLRSGQKLIPVPAGIATLVPYVDDRYVIQTLSPVPSTSAGLSVETNKVCILTLEEDTTGPAGTTYIVTEADCEDANDLECETTCSQSVGWTITIPGGTELLSGN
ncbi:MAG: hypothetical protein ACON4Z_01385 [Planctomycetota bacterium]